MSAFVPFVRIRRRAPALFVVSLLLGSVVASTATAAESPDKRYRDRNIKFSLRYFSDWDQIPLETEGKSDGLSFFVSVDKYLVAKFSQQGAAKRNIYASELRIFRLGKGAKGLDSGTTTGGGESDPLRDKLKEKFGEKDPTSMKELFDKALDNYGFAGFLDAKAAKPIKTRDGVPGQLWVVEKKSERSSEDQPFLHVFATWKKDDLEIGVWYFAEPTMKKRYEQGFVASVKSMTWFDDHAEDVREIASLKDLPIPNRKKRQIEKGLVQGWDVLVSKKKQYIIIYDTNNNRNKQLASILADRIEAIREQVYERMFPPSQPITAVSIARVCKDRSQYHQYGGPGGSAGYWSSDTEELVFYDASPSRRIDDDTLAVLYHEAFHQYIYYSVGEVAPHSWFNEGHGDYFAGARYSGGKFSIKPFNWRVETIKNAIRNGVCPTQEETDSDGDSSFKFDRSNGGYSPLSALVKMSQGDYYSYPGISYAQGWSLIYFLREAVPKNPKWNEKWGKILPTYFDTLKGEVAKKRKLAPKAPPAEEPDDGGDDEPDTPGMGEPGMDDPGMGEPGMDDPGMGEPGMDDPGMGEPGMDDPGMGGDEPPSGDGDPGIPQVFSRFFRDDGGALRKAIEEAFRGVDFEELEKAWADYTKKVR